VRARAHVHGFHGDVHHWSWHFTAAISVYDQLAMREQLLGNVVLTLLTLERVVLVDDIRLLQLLRKGGVICEGSLMLCGIDPLRLAILLVGCKAKFLLLLRSFHALGGSFKDVKEHFDVSLPLGSGLLRLLYRFADGLRVSCGRLRE